MRIGSYRWWFDRRKDEVDGFAACFEDLDDPRTGNAERHDLLEIVMIALCTVLLYGEAPPNWWTPLISSDGSGRVSNGPGTPSI
jgi:hypothetical protein